MGKEIKDSGEQADDAKGKFSGFTSVLSGMGTALKAAAAATAAAVAGAATAIGALTTKAIEGYAAQEQLVGGVETLFKTSSDTVVGYANDAYKTAGMSANEYMETVTSFSASLLASMNMTRQRQQKRQTWQLRICQTMQIKWVLIYRLYRTPITVLQSRIIPCWIT